MSRLFEIINALPGEDLSAGDLAQLIEKLVGLDVIQDEDQYYYACKRTEDYPKEVQEAVLSGGVTPLISRFIKKSLIVRYNFRGVQYVAMHHGCEYMMTMEMLVSPNPIAIVVRAATAYADSNHREDLLDLLSLLPSIGVVVPSYTIHGEERAAYVSLRKD